MPTSNSKANPLTNLGTPGGDPDLNCRIVAFASENVYASEPFRSRIKKTSVFPSASRRRVH